MHIPAIFIASDAVLRQAALLMVEKRIGALLVGAADRPPEGIITERDLLKASAAAADFDTTMVRQAMTAPVQTMAGEEMLYRALARMDRFGIRHMPIAGAGGRALGVVSQRDLLHHRTSSALVLEDALHEAHSPAELAAAYGRVPQVAAQLARSGLSGIDIAHVISTELREVSARAAELAVAAMKAAGRGDPPAPWCLFLLGSAGRGESLLGADQDNALIHAGTDADDAWFAEMGGYVAAFLDEAGIVRCKGGVMAVNAEWRGTRDGWRRRVDKWLSRADPKDLLNVDIFFDMIPVAGDVTLGTALREEAVRAASRATTFLGLLAQETENLTPQFGLFGALKTEDGRIEMKRQGLLPVVNFARTAALKIASPAHATPDRLRDAVAAGRVAERDAEAMIETHALALGLILRQQIADLEAGIRPSNKVAAAIMTKNERERLKSGLSRIENVIRDVRSLMAGR
jgi:DNA polymerase-3 subunit epsilon/CBS domain-containing protein